MFHAAFERRAVGDPAELVRAVAGLLDKPCGERLARNGGDSDPAVGWSAAAGCGGADAGSTASTCDQQNDEKNADDRKRSAETCRHAAAAAAAAWGRSAESTCIGAIRRMRTKHRARGMPAAFRTARASEAAAAAGKPATGKAAAASPRTAAAPAKTAAARSSAGSAASAHRSFPPYISVKETAVAALPTFSHNRC